LSCALDRQGHGTHCAGTAAGTTYGVAPEASVRAVKTLSDAGSGQLSWQIAGIDWVTVQGARPAILSMSLGAGGVYQSFVAAIDAAVDAGVVVVVAGGNENMDACRVSPAFVESAITVGSTTSLDQRSYFSNYGSCTNLWAPGSDILSAWTGSDDATRTISGTSMACPHVSGAAALILSADGTKRAPEVLQQLLDDAFLNVLSDLRSGDTNALLCVAEGGAPPTPTPQPTPVPPPGSWVVSGDGCVEDGECMQSLNHPNNYDHNTECSITLYGDVSILVESFNTEEDYDILTMNGTRYSGTRGPPSGVYSGVIEWTSDRSISSSGWRLCKGAASTPQPTPAPTSQPTPAPTSQPTPAPTPEPTPQPTHQTTPAPRIYCPRNECRGSGWVSKDQSCGPGESKGCWNVDDVYQCCDNYCENNECASGWVHQSVGCATGQSIDCWNVDHLYHCCATSG